MRDTMKYPEIAKRFRYIMNLRNKKAVDLAEDSGVSAATISHYVNGSRCPSTDIALKLGKILNCNPIWLMDLDEKMTISVFNIDKTGIEEEYRKLREENKYHKYYDIINSLNSLPEESQNKLINYFKAMIEAESYNGPSLIIAYAPCINHGIKGGMSIAQAEEKKAVESGYWHCFRFDPRLKAEGKNPFMLDSKKPSLDYKDFLMGEVRYNSLAMANPERAEKLFESAVKAAEEKYEKLAKMAEQA